MGQDMVSTLADDHKEFMEDFCAKNDRKLNIEYPTYCVPGYNDQSGYKDLVWAATSGSMAGEMMPPGFCKKKYYQKKILSLLFFRRVGESIWKIILSLVGKC